jgi:aspartate carbamoyltransferase catalytic subunit
VTIVGDILHSRVARSNIFGLMTLGANVRLCGPPTLLPHTFAELGCELYHDLATAARDADVIMMLRIQRERQSHNFFPTLDEYAHYFCLTEEVLAEAKSDVVILHPGPMNRGIEISSGVADGPYSLMMNQVANGVALRMAVLYQLIVPGADGIRGSRVTPDKTVAPAEAVG